MILVGIIYMYYDFSYFILVLVFWFLMRFVGYVVIVVIVGVDRSFSGGIYLEVRNIILVIMWF